MSDVTRWRSEVPLVGRADDVSALVDPLVDGADGTDRRLGRGGAVLLAGDAGVGKTRLLREVARLAREAGVTVLVGHCVDIGDVGLPYLPFTEILTSIARDPALAPVLERHPGVDRLLATGHADTPTADTDRGPDSRSQLLEAVSALLADVAATAPKGVLVVIEDLHWADRSTRELLHYLFSRLRDDPLTVIASYRSDDLHRRHPLRPLLAELVRLPSVTRRFVEPLSDEAVGELVAALHPDPLRRSVVDGIVRRVEGNAFYAEELLAATMETGGPSGDQLPWGLADVLLARIEQLPATAQRIVRIASVSGRKVSHELLRTVAELDEDGLDQALREALGRHVLVSDEGDTYAFRHALLRDAVYADLLPGERARLHSAFAHALNGPQWGPRYAALRAHHFAESHDLPGALRASLEAADHAAAVGAPAEELQQLERALDLWAAVPDAAEIAGQSDILVTLRATTAAAAAGEHNRALALTRSALDRTGSSTDAELTARIRYTLARSLMYVDRDEAAYKESSAALALIPEDPPSSTWVWAAATHVRTSFYVGDFEGARDLGVRAMRAAEQAGATDALSDLLISLAPVTTPGRTTKEGRAQLERALDLAESIEDKGLQLRAIFNLAIGAYEAADLPEALRRSRQGAELARRSGLAASVYGIEQHYIEALALHALGRWDELLDLLGSVSAPEVEFAHARSLADLVAASRGEPLHLEGPSVGGPEQLVHPATVLNRSGALLEELVWKRDADGVLGQFDAVATALLDQHGETGLPLLRPAGQTLGAVADRIEDALRTDDTAAVRRWRDEADRILGLAEKSADERSAFLFEQELRGPEAQAWLALLRAEHGRAMGTGDQVAAWRAAADGFGYGAIHLEAWARWRLAEALVAAGDREAAEREADAAYAAAQSLRAAPLVTAVAALRRRARLGPDGERDADLLLTPRERDVLRLVARGRSNRQIGAELFISDKTASVHVSNILAKLSASTRAEAAAIALRDGLV